MVLKKAQYKVSNDGLWKDDSNILLVFNSNFIFVRHCLRDNEVFLQTGNDIINAAPLRVLYMFFSDGLWIDDTNFLLVSNSNLICIMHRFQDNDASLKTGNDVMVICQLEAPYIIFR